MKLLLTTLFLSVTLVYVSAQYKIGDIIDDLTTVSYNEQDISIDDFEDQSGLIVVFTSYKCKAATAYNNKLSALHKKYAPQAYPVLAVDITPLDEDEEDEDKARRKLAKLIEDNEIDYLYAVDPEKDLFSSFVGARKNVPYAFVLRRVLDEDDEEGLKVVYMGAIDGTVKGFTRSYVDLAVSKNLKIKNDSGDDEDDVDSRKKSRKKSKFSYLEVTKASGCPSVRIK